MWNDATDELSDNAQHLSLAACHVVDTRDAVRQFAGEPGGRPGCVGLFPVSDPRLVGDKSQCGIEYRVASEMLETLVWQAQVCGGATWRLEASEAPTSLRGGMLAALIA